MALPLAILSVCALATILSVRYLVIRGIESVCLAFRFSNKTKGQILGYATSLPELVVVIAAALAGVFEAGFWNIASSNIINWCLFLSALLVYRQHRDLWQAKFIDEITFGLLGVAIPLVLLGLKVPLTTVVAAGLVAFFVIYKIVDHKMNPHPPREERDEPTLAEGETPPPALPVGIGLLIAGLLVVIIAGRYLGGAAESLIVELDIPAWMVGWVLGFITSIPELTAFFEIYRLHKKRGTLDLDDDTQEALDALVASNLSNLGIILPIGVFLLTLVS